LSISDLDAGSATVTVTLAVSPGTLSLGAQSGTTTITLTDTLANINATLDGLTFTPPLNSEGMAILTITTNDRGNTGGGALIDVDTVTITIIATNHAPQLDTTGSPQLVDLTYQSATNSGSSIADIFAALSVNPITDLDIGDAAGIAITGSDTAHGSWEYSLNDGTSWLALGTPSATAARLLAADPATRVRFVPANNYLGQISSALTFHAWDLTSGANGGTEDVTTNGGATAYSTASDTISVAVVSQFFTISGANLSINAASSGGDMSILFTSATTFSATVAGKTLIVDTSSVNAINVNGGSSVDAFYLYLPSGTDQAIFGINALDVTGTGYTLHTVGVEKHITVGGTNDSALFNDGTSASLFYMLPTHAIHTNSSRSFFNEPIGFGQYAANGSGLNDSLFFYSTAAGAKITASATQVKHTTTGVSMVANNFKDTYVYGSGTNDFLVYNGSTMSELFTSWSSYSYINSPGMIRYYDRFNQITVNSDNGTGDAAVMYDSRGNDTYTGSVGSAELRGTGFRNVAVNFSRVYAYQTGGVDIANITGSADNDRIVGNAKWTSVTSTGYFQQLLGFSVVNVTGGTNGVDTVDLTDSTGNDSLTASRDFVELVYASGKRIKVSAIDKVAARGTNGGVNRKSVASSLTYTLNFTGRWQ
ncbi:MAG: hypothetical protein JNM18_03515, partial [Planctomycetaceae bacterium]|nr:hypothetical protein [Planctomycetaceae bacterium]